MDHHYSVTLALATNPSRTKHQSEWAENAIQVLDGKLVNAPNNIGNAAINANEAAPTVVILFRIVDT